MTQYNFWLQEIFSVFGDPLFWGWIAFFNLFAFSTEKVKKFSKAVFVFLIINVFVVVLAKLVFGTPRPTLTYSNNNCCKDRRLLGPLNYSFPSGHASIAFGILVVLIPLFILKRQFYNFGYLLFATFLTILVCLSRITLKKHYPIDILGGVFVSLFISLPITLWIV